MYSYQTDDYLHSLNMQCVVDTRCMFEANPGDCSQGKFPLMSIWVFSA